MLKDNRGAWPTFILTIILFQFIVDITVIFDIPVARQVLSFIYLTFLLGIIPLKMFNTQNLDFIEKFLFSIGLSVAFVMFLGLIANQIGLSLGSLAVLSTPILLLSTNFAVFVLCVLSYFLNRNMQLDLRKIDFPQLSILTICFPFLAMVGTTLVNFSGNSVILLLLIGIIALTILTSSVKAQANRPLILFMITVAILFHVSLISYYIVGYDVHPAYHVFKIARNSGVWNPLINETDPVTPRTNQMLSVTIFPAIYSNMLDLEGTLIFKIIYPLIFALVPLGLYTIYQKYMQKKTAFVASILILANLTFFYEMPGLPTQMIGEFFLVLMLIAMFHEGISPAKKMGFFIIFSAGIIMSHYGVSYVTLGLIIITWFVLSLAKKQLKIKTTYSLLFFIMVFSWYIYTSQSASFNSLLEMGDHISRRLWAELLNPQSRAQQVLTGIGAGAPAASALHWLGRVFHYAVQLLIVLGILGVLMGWKKDYKFDREYVIMALLMLTFVLAPLVVPSFNLLNITRMYHLSLLFLAPFCMVGGKFFFSFFQRLREGVMPFVLTLVIVLMLFLFETGFIYEATGDVSYSISLSKYRLDRSIVYGNGYVLESADVASAEWLGKNIDATTDTIVYADIVSAHLPLTSYAVLPRDHTALLSNVTVIQGTNSYVYLRKFNTFDGKIFSGRLVWNTSDLIPQFQSLNRIYTNSGSEIYSALNVTTP